MALWSPCRCPWRWPSALPLALAVMLSCLAQGSLVGAALGAVGAWCALRFRPPARSPPSRRTPARFLLPPRPSRLLLPTYRPSLIARFPSPWAQADRHATIRRARNCRPAAGVCSRDSKPTRGNCLGAPTQAMRRKDPLLLDWSPGTFFPPETWMCVGVSPQSCRGVSCEVSERRGREPEVRQPRCTQETTNKVVQTEEAVEKPEEKRRQSLSPPPSPGNGRPRRRSICLLVPWDNEPLVLPPAPDPGYPITAEIIEEERQAAQQRLRRLLGHKADVVPSTSGEGMSLGTAIAQGSSGTSRIGAASATTTSVISGLANSTSTGFTDTPQASSRSVPVLGGSSTPASSIQRRSRIRGSRKRIKAWIHHSQNPKGWKGPQKII